MSSLLTICGLEELEGHRTRAVTHVLSILDPEWPEPDFGPYGQATVRTVLRFHDIIEPTPGMVMPKRSDVEAVLAFGRGIAADPAGPEAHLLVHCHAGISRSTASMTAILAQAFPADEEAAIVARVSAIRPIAWPNLTMIEFADALLARNGRLVAAVGDLYGRRLAERPELAETMIRLGRAREVEFGRERAGVAAGAAGEAAGAA